MFATLRPAAKTSVASPRGRWLNLIDQPIKDSEEVADGIVVDYDEEDRIVGIEILDASKRTDHPEVLEQFSSEMPTAG